jgi:hypothetical protein
MKPGNPVYTALVKGCDFNATYRTFDGSCNNIQRPWVGMANTPFKRYMKPNYADGVGAIKGSSVEGKSLPNARLLSAYFGGDNSALDTRWTNFMPIFGQFVTHDITALEPQEIDCPCNSTNPNCISVPVSDSKIPVSCITMSRSADVNTNLKCNFGINIAWLI